MRNRVMPWLSILFSAFGGWWSAMSGAISIPLAFLGLFSNGAQPKWWFALLAFIALWVCVLIMAYGNFPKFRLSCGTNIPGCAVPNDNHTLKFLRVCVQTTCMKEVENCLGHLTKIEKNGEIIFDHESRELPFAPSTSSDSLAKTVFPRTPFYLDVLA